MASNRTVGVQRKSDYLSGAIDDGDDPGVAHLEQRRPISPGEDADLALELPHLKGKAANRKNQRKSSQHEEDEAAMVWTRF
ncbi:hypothetical protein CFC21_069056 [Triticum aestivum]|uniref:Uncharacterized protein n=3 Tax=Triticum TaxID=4564 RepID=A0A9R1KQB6_WHEAT|nr:hypothetical protein CFC21_069029 [Triticum aestivum]KAF7062456.1 hypothetical protein CFC21_069056 [Triticum aestivum]VAI25264.1 unnamed protein product [Triticum turgidum subsp. durum]